LFSAIGDGYDDIRKQTRSVGVTTSTVDMDVVPIIEPDGEAGALYIPDRTLEKWIPTNPPGHTQWTTDVNTKAGGRFKPLVKLIKWWRRQNPTGGARQPKGFVLECMVAECMDFNETHYGELTARLFESIVGRYALQIAFGLVPHIADPAVPGNNVLSNVSFDDFKSFYELVKEHADIARATMNVDDEDGANELWRLIFGARFARKSEKAAGLLSGAIASSPGMFDFPDRAVKPKRPAGFA
jgi:hypothetical protein